MSETIVINENVGHVTQIVPRTATGTARLFSIVGGADADRFRLDPETGALSFLQLPDFENPSDQDLGNLYEVIVRISDGEVEEDQSLSVEVADVDEAVDLDDSSGFAVARSENALWVYDFHAVDPEGRPIVYSISGEDAHLFTIDASTGVLSFVAPPDYEAPFAGDRPNNYSVDVTASDGVTSDSVYLQVIVVNDNEPIAITSFGGAAAASLAASENQVFVAMITAADVDGDSPWYAIVGGADAARFRLDYLGRLTFRAPPDHENPTDSDGDNVYEVIVSASDGEFSDTQTLFVAVADEQWVTITSSEGADSASVSVAENGGTLVGTVAAVAEGGAPVSYSLAGGADAHLFTIDGTTGVLRFRWWPDFERPEDADGDNVYDVVVRASGGSAGDEQSLAIQVLDFASDLHIVSDGGGDDATIGLSENQSAVTVVQASGGATPSYSLIGDDAHLFTIDAGGALRFIAAPNFEAPADADGDNVYDVTVKAGDGEGEDAQVLRIVVGDVTSSLKLSASFVDYAGGIRRSENNVVVTTVRGDSGDGAVAFAIVGGADAALFTLDPVTGALRFTVAPNFEAPADAGGNNVYEVVIEGRDEETTDTMAIFVTVTDVHEGGVTITGSSSSDTITPTATLTYRRTTAGDDVVNALGGNDTIDGGDGNDRIDAGAGSDSVKGSGGADLLTGGSGTDTFLYSALSDSPMGAADRITDFRRYEYDRINLTGVDANTLATGNQMFSFIGGNAFTGLPGQLRFERVGPDTWLLGDVDGDTVADLQIILTGAITPTSGDFWL